MDKEHLESHKNVAILVEMEEMWSFHRDKRRQIWLWRAIDQESGEAAAFWFGRREDKNVDKLTALFEPLDRGKVYTDGDYAYYERFSPEVLVATKKDTQKIERKHLSLRRWRARLARKGVRFSKTEQMRKIVVGLILNVWFLGSACLLQ